jgi:hypothetical protein
MDNRSNVLELERHAAGEASATSDQIGARCRPPAGGLIDDEQSLACRP